MTSSHHGPYDEGYHVLQWRIQKKRPREASGPHKVRRSPDWSLQLDSMKSESLVIVDQNATSEYVQALHTPPVTPWGVGCQK